MPITAAESWILRVPFTPSSADRDDAHHEIIGVTLDEGPHRGTGFTYLSYNGGGRAVKALIDDLLLPRLIGRASTEVAAIWQELFLLTHRMGTGLNRFAMSAVDIALWDLKAKQRGVPLAVELGALADRVPAYGSGKAGTRLSIDEVVRLSAGYAEEGLAAVKLRVGGIPPADAVDRVRRVRAAVGDDVGILCDANEKLDLAEALVLGRSLADLGVLWLEEPLLSTRIEGHRLLAERLPLLIAGGEHHCSADEFVPYIEKGAFQVLQPNVCMVGGFTEMMRIARMCEQTGLGFAPHLMSELHVHVAAATTSTLYLEYFPFLAPYVRHPLALVEGMAVVPETPGHGVEFTPQAIERYRTA